MKSHAYTWKPVNKTHKHNHRCRRRCRLTLYEIPFNLFLIYSHTISRKYTDACTAELFQIFCHEFADENLHFAYSIHTYRNPKYSQLFSLPLSIPVCVCVSNHLCRCCCCSLTKCYHFHAYFQEIFCSSFADLWPKSTCLYTVGIQFILHDIQFIWWHFFFRLVRIQYMWRKINGNIDAVRIFHRSDVHIWIWNATTNATATKNLFQFEKFFFSYSQHDTIQWANVSIGNEIHTENYLLWTSQLRILTFLNDCYFRIDNNDAVNSLFFFLFQNSNSKRFTRGFLRIMIHFFLVIKLQN